MRTKNNSHTDLKLQVIAQLNEPKVVITCGPQDFVRNVMLTARRYNLTDPTKNVWYTIDLFNASYFGHGAWQRGDNYDLEAYEAFKGKWSLENTIRVLLSYYGLFSKCEQFRLFYIVKVFLNFKQSQTSFHM